MAKQFDLSVMGISGVVTSSNLYNSEVDRFNGVVSDERLAGHLAAITTSDKTSDALGIAKAFHAWSVTKEDAKREGFKNESELLANLTGLSKSSISQLRTVGALFANDDGNFYVPDSMRGFTVGQIYEVMAKNKGIVNSNDFKVICDENDITCITSAKDIRGKLDSMTVDEREKVNNAKALKSARNKLEKDGYTLPIYDKDGKELGVVAVISLVSDAMSDSQREKFLNHDVVLTLEYVD